jgi:hypothetical protein
MEYTVKSAFKVVRFIVPRQHRMIGRLRAEVKQMQSAFRVGGGFRYHPFETVLAQGVAA